MRFLIAVISGLLVFSSSLFSQTPPPQKVYQYTVDLTNIVNDRINVQLTVPAQTSTEVTFFLPKIIPGTYAIADYGRYVTDFTAVDKKGNALVVERVDDNSWKIKGALALHKISYWVDDSWDSVVTGPEIFWPAGTNIEEGKNFVINTSGFFGYFDGEKEFPFHVNVIRSKDLYGSTGMIPTSTGVSASKLKLEKGKKLKDKFVDVYESSDYDELIDSPLMYSKPDTAIIKVANTEVLIGSYSPNNKVTAKEIAESIKEVLMAQKEYLGGTLPVSKYAFIFYFFEKPVPTYGALEHSYSSFYYMPEMTIDQMRPQLRDFASHEFFHIVTPLTIHSKEIQDFDFNSPKMSQHLWMYEGVTEYFASHMQVQYGLISPEEFVETMIEKLHVSDQFKNDVPITDLSKYTLDTYHDQYYNFYQKGAALAMCLDLKLRSLSNGTYGLRNLMIDLSKKYGKDQAFNDDELFDVITKMTYPDMEDFFSKYVKGAEKLPLTEMLNTVGIMYLEQDTIRDFSLGLDNENITVTELDGKNKLQIATADRMNAMAKAIGFKDGDILLKINGQVIPDLGPETQDEFGLFVQGMMMSLGEGKKLSYTVLRKDTSGENKEVELSAPVQKIMIVQRHSIQPSPMATQQQRALRESWLKAK